MKTQPKMQRVLEEGEEYTLLEELEIDPENIKKKFINILKFKACESDTLHESDLVGPIIIFVIVGFLLVF